MRSLARDLVALTLLASIALLHPGCGRGDSSSDREVSEKREHDGTEAHDEQAEHEDHAEHDEHAELAEHEDQAEHEDDAEHAEHAERAEGEEHSDEHSSEGIWLPPESRTLAELKTEVVSSREIRDQTRATGEIQVNSRRVARIVSRVSGWVEEVRRIRGDRVSRGDIVLTITSPEYQAAGRELLTAHDRLDRAEERGDSSEVRTVRAIYESAVKRLLLFGESAEEIEALPHAHSIAPVVHVHSPFDGTILEDHTVPGQRVEAGTELCLISDLATVWGILNVQEKDLASIRVGAPASLSVSAYPGEAFSGKVTFIDNLMDEATRTVKVRVEVPNQDRRLKPGMFVEALIGNDSVRRALAIPLEALQREGSEHFVFVATKDRFLRRDVEPGISDGGVVEVVHGLAEGDSIVVAGAFLLKSEMLKAGFEEGHAH